MRIQARFQSIRSIVTSIIIVLGLLSMAATLITGQVYHSLTLRSQLENIEHQLHGEITKGLQRLKQFSLQLSTLITNSEEFKQGIAQAQAADVNRYLVGLQKIPFLQSGVLSIQYAYVYNESDTLIAGLEYTKNTTSASTESVCGKVLSISKPTSYALATEVVYALCVYGDKPYLSARVPFSTGKHNGYLELVSDIGANLAHIDQVMNFPIRLRLKNQTKIFISDSWPVNYDENSVAVFPIKNDFGKTVLFIDALHLDSNLEEALSFAQLLVISGAVASILVAVILALFILKQTVISPVSEVVSSLRKVRDNRENLGAQVKSRGAEEIVQLMNDFNAMSSALEQLYSTLEKMTYTDTLTRLGNRKLFHEKLQQVYLRAEQVNGRFALLIIDLDKFKQVNDTYGHMIGDKLLEETSNRFSDVMRTSHYVESKSIDTIATPVQDLLARLGGDEFSIIVPNISDQEEVINFAKRLAASIHQPMVLDGQEIDFGLSMGISLYPQHAKTIDELIHCADVAMYESKRLKQDFKIYSPEMDKLP